VIVVADEPKWAQVANAIFLLSGGLLALAVLVAVYARLREVEPSFALLALVLGLAGGLGSAIHGAQEFALEVRKENATDTGLSAVDPRGFLTFAVSGPALLLIGWLVRRGGLFPSGSET
jgi:Na+/glutamate symporter